jgi:hypothetical protein
MGGDVTAELNYLIKTTDGLPAWLQASREAGYLITNFGQEPTRVTIHDLRGKENSVDLDTNALEVIKYEGSIQEEFEDGSEAQLAHHEEMSNIIKKHLGASRVLIYAYVFRSRGTLRPIDQVSDHYRNPGFLVHTDIDGNGVREKIKQLLGEEEAKKLMQNRYEALNIWRPLGPNPIVDKPLTICDYRSLDIEKDIHPLDLQGSLNTTTGHTISPSAQDAHQWYYLSEMRSNEMFIFKMFDSKNDVAQCAFHTAFINENVPPSNMDQTSLELRCFVFYD